MSRKEGKLVFTGSGIVNGSGSSVAEIWEQVSKGESSVRPYEQWDGANWPVKVASEISLRPRDLVPERKLHKSISQTDMFGIYASEQAISNSGFLDQREGLEEEALNQFNDRSGLIVGSGAGSYCSNYDYFPLMEEVNTELPQFGKELSNMVTPMWLLKNLPNNVLCHVGIRSQLKGTNACITNQCSSGIMAVAESAAAIWNGEADRIVAAGHDDPFEPEMVLQFHKLGLMSGEAPRPFDVNRDGTVFGQGAAAVVIEKEAEANSRGATVLGEFLGFGCCSEATGILDLDPEGDGVTRAIEQALADADLTPSDVGMICAHGNGTPASDRTEAFGIREVFGDAIPPVTSFKWAYGHMIGASGITDLVLSLECLRQGTVPGIATLSEVEPGIADFPVQEASTEPTSDVALVICRGFGGMNVVLAIRA
ncbi:MAG: beta-ketoacyl-[acyl-carrier-protein] synthase family protein [Verrucomicrobiales bacterium]|nr:beta-ketoacyl-[acyl-carrier-protein] synthase family protein [Verrucomicrobiales bacterium]